MTKDESDLIIAEQNKSTEEILKAVAKVKSDYKELCNLKDMRIAELEKENAELKKRVDNLYNSDCWAKDQLVKAKEIIKDLMSFSVQLCDCRHTVDFEKTREQAVQFIKEIEK